MGEALRRAVVWGCVRFVCVLVLLVAWNIWPTDSSSGHEIVMHRFYLHNPFS